MEKMVIITFHVTKEIMEMMDSLIARGVYPNRSVLIRQALSDLLKQYYPNGYPNGAQELDNIDNNIEILGNVDKREENVGDKTRDRVKVLSIKLSPPLRRLVKEIVGFIESSRGRRICVTPSRFAKELGVKHILTRLTEAVLIKAGVTYDVYKNPARNTYCFSREDKEKILGAFRLFL